MSPTRLTTLSLAVFIVVGAAACSATEGGTPQPSSEAPSASAGEPSTNGSQGRDVTALSELDPCSLLNTDDVAEHGAVKAPERTTVGNSPTCNWHADAPDTAAAVPSTAIAIRENGGVQAMNDMGQGVEVVEEGGREYGRTPGPDGCAIGIGVTEQSRVDVLVTGVPTGQACDIANALVEKAEPNVPRG